MQILRISRVVLVAGVVILAYSISSELRVNQSKLSEFFEVFEPILLLEVYHLNPPPKFLRGAVIVFSSNNIQG